MYSCLKRCSHHWKAKAVAIEIYSGLDKPKKNGIKIEDEDDEDEDDEEDDSDHLNSSLNEHHQPGDEDVTPRSKLLGSATTSKGKNKDVAALLDVPREVHNSNSKRKRAASTPTTASHDSSHLDRPSKLLKPARIVVANPL